MGFFVTAACGLLGNFLILRKMSMLGDAISHSALPGIVVAFLISGQRNSFSLMLGAIVAGL
ncbi:MAG: metal ABC transporter permease, partial [Verrucomicrobiota bacterium]